MKAYTLFLTLYNYVVLEIEVTRRLKASGISKEWRIESAREVTSGFPYAVSLAELNILEEKIIRALGDPDEDPVLIQINHSHGLGFAFRVIEDLSALCLDVERFALQIQDPDYTEEWYTIELFDTLEEARHAIFNADSSRFSPQEVNGWLKDQDNGFPF